MRNKDCFVFFFLFICFFKIYPSAIVFVHLGEDVPSCLFTVIDQAKYLNPDKEIYLLTDEIGYRNCIKKNDQFFLREQVHLINMSSFPASFLHKRFHEVNKMVCIDNANYWTYASERFFVLYDFLEQIGITEVVHLENDCMLYVDIEEILPVLRKENVSLAAPFTSLKGCIPCFVFIRSSSDLVFLLEHIIKTMDAFKGKKPNISVNDMSSLASFYSAVKEPFFQPLPTLMVGYLDKCFRRKSSYFFDNETPIRFLSKHAQIYHPYLFDAATLGIYVGGGGRDSAAGCIYGRSLFHPGYFSFYWGRDRIGRSVPYLSFEGVEYRIVNLHFYSKRPEHYRSFSLPLGLFPKLADF